MESESEFGQSLKNLYNLDEEKQKSNFSLSFFSSSKQIVIK